ncbi:MAG: succinate dehydrogenase, hydrophobic membrane anchor protein [Gammaproteobacteria bacterium]|jgi:succinate dehydrogenase / fumarate reductase membrane anchor subunit
MSLRTPLGRALGLGSAKDGTSHWWSQRVSAAALAILGPWFVVALTGLDGFDFETVSMWLRAPLNAILMIILVATLFYHSSLGVQVVIEDYVHDSGNKVVSLVLAKFLHLFVAVVGIFAVLRISFGA